MPAVEEIVNFFVMTSQSFTTVKSGVSIFMYNFSVQQLHCIGYKNIFIHYKLPFEHISNNNKTFFSYFVIEFYEQ